jgi:formamidopyrimidine-DNA glycosylase
MPELPDIVVSIEVLQATVEQLAERLGDGGDGFPEMVTAFRAGMAVHGRFGKPCPVRAWPGDFATLAANRSPN